MFRKLLICLVVLCFAMTTYAEDGLKFWSLGEQSIVTPDKSLLLRLGMEEDNKEFGLQTTFLPSAEPELPEIYGMYGLYHFPDVIDINNPIPFDFLPEKVQASVYLGGQITVDFGEDDVGSYTGFIAGTIINEVIVIEYQNNRFGDELAGIIDSNASSIYLGLRIEF